jgi:hypothetical protein
MSASTSAARIAPSRRDDDVSDFVGHLVRPCNHIIDPSRKVHNAERVLRPIAEMLSHLDLETGLQHMPHQIGQQPTLTGQRNRPDARERPAARPTPAPTQAPRPARSRLPKRPAPRP